MFHPEVAMRLSARSLCLLITLILVHFYIVLPALAGNPSFDTRPLEIAPVHEVSFADLVDGSDVRVG